MSAMESVKVGRKVVEVVQDEDPINPRSDGNLGKMVCWHRKYDLGDKHEFKSPDDFRAEWNKDNAVILPLYLYDHSGITMNTSGFSHCDPGHWDSGQVGYIYVSLDGIRSEYKKVNDETIALATKVLQGEVEVYDQYLRGEVYGYVVKVTKHCKACGRSEDKIVDSCWGYYGVKDALEAGKEAAKCART